MLGTVSPAEVVWVVVAGWSAASHSGIYRRIRRDIRLLESGAIPASAGAMALFRSDAGSERDWALWKIGITVVGLVRMTQPAPTLDWQQVTIVTVITALVLWTRWSSVLRGRRRQRVICGRERG